MEHFSGSHEEFDLLVVPVVKDAKQQEGTLLLAASIGVRPRGRRQRRTAPSLNGAKHPQRRPGIRSKLGNQPQRLSESP